MLAFKRSALTYRNPFTRAPKTEATNSPTIAATSATTTTAS